tara:strand:+ start:1134 stop:1400 length:267 start_codon:yes stop_codon:yes gene_type:complete
MSKKRIINAIVQIEKESGSFDDSLLDQLKELDLDELKGILKDYDPGLTDQYTKKKTKPKKVVTVKRGGMIKKFSSGGAAKRGFGKVIK